MLRCSGALCSFVCVFSGRSRLERRCICLHGANDLEDQGGHKGQKMTSDPSTPSAQEASPCSQRVQVRVSEETLGQTEAEVVSGESEFVVD